MRAQPAPGVLTCAGRTVQMALFRPLCKFCATIRRVRDIVPTLRTALQQAQSGTPGPVFVEFPIDTLYPIALVRREIGRDKSAGADASRKSLMSRLVGWYLDRYVNQVRPARRRHRAAGRH